VAYLLITNIYFVGQKQSEANKENALKNQHPHTLGRKPVAKLRKEMVM
jgi:hypothetical protein